MVDGVIEQNGIRPLRLSSQGPLVRVGSVPNRIAVDRSVWFLRHVREKALPYHFAPVPVPGFDRYTILNKEDYYASTVQINILLTALREGKMELAVLALPELPRELPTGIRLAAIIAPTEANFALVYPREAQLKAHDRVGVYHFSLLQQMRSERPGLQYDQRFYSFEQALQMMNEGRWKAVLLPQADLLYAEEIGEFSFESLPVSGVVPPAGQGALALLVKEQDDALAASLFAQLHNHERERRFRMEVALADLLSTSNERAGSCLWREENRYFLALYNPHLTQYINRFACAPVSELGGALRRESCYSVLKQVMGELNLVGIGPGDYRHLTLEAEQVLRETEYLICEGSEAEQLYYLLDGRCQILDIENNESMQTLDGLVGQIQICLRRGYKTSVLLLGDGCLHSKGAVLANALVDARIPFHLRPGMSMIDSNLARLGVPVVFSGLADSAHLFDCSDPLFDTYQFTSFRGTLIFNLVLTQLFALQSRLMEQGISPHTPALYMRAGGWGDLEHCVGTLGAIHQQIQSRSITEKGFLILGEVVRLQNKLYNRENQLYPLRFCTILAPMLTQLSAEAQAQLRTWSDKGAHIIHLQLLSLVQTDSCRLQLTNFFEQLTKGTLQLPAVIRPHEQARIRHRWSDLADRERRKAKDLRALSGHNWLVFFSEEAVEIFFATYRKSGYDIRQLGQYSFAVPAGRVQRKLAAEGIQAEYVAPGQDEESLAIGMGTFLQSVDQVVVFKEVGETTMPEHILKNSPAPMISMGIYERQVRLPSDQQFMHLFKELDVIAFMSADVAHAFAQSMALAKLGHDAIRSKSIRLFAANADVRAALEERGFIVAGDFSQLGEI